MGEEGGEEGGGCISYRNIVILGSNSRVRVRCVTNQPRYGNLSAPSVLGLAIG